MLKILLVSLFSFFVGFMTGSNSIIKKMNKQSNPAKQKKKEDGFFKRNVKKVFW